MRDTFSEPISKLPQADIPLEGLKAYLSQASDHQIVFMEFEKDVELAEHSHASQYGIVLEGKIDLVIGGVSRTFVKGDRYVIPEGVVHSGKIHADYADVSFFDFWCLCGLISAWFAAVMPRGGRGVHDRSIH